MKKLLMTMSFLIASVTVLVASEGYSNNLKGLYSNMLNARAFEKIKEALECQAFLEHKELSVEEVREILDIEGKLLSQELYTGIAAKIPEGYSRILDIRYCDCAIGSTKSYIRDQAQQDWVEILTQDYHRRMTDFTSIDLIAHLRKLNPQKYRGRVVLKLQYELPPLVTVLMPSAPEIRTLDF